MAGKVKKANRGAILLLLGKEGLEPPTLRLSSVYSYLLSYLPPRKGKAL